MACGVTKSTYFGTVTCDNAGTSAHSGQHSGVLGTFFNSTSNVRLTWSTSDAHAAYVRALTVGDKT